MGSLKLRRWVLDEVNWSLSANAPQSEPSCSTLRSLQSFDFKRGSNERSSAPNFKLQSQNQFSKKLTDFLSERYVTPTVERKFCVAERMTPICGVKTIPRSISAKQKCLHREQKYHDYRKAMRSLCESATSTISSNWKKINSRSLCQSSCTVIAAGLFNIWTTLVRCYLVSFSAVRDRLSSRTATSLGHQVGQGGFQEGPNFFKLCPTHFSREGRKNF